MLDGELSIEGKAVGGEARPGVKARRSLLKIESSGPHRPWSAAEIETVRQMRQDGVAVTEIVQSLDSRSELSIRAIIGRHHIKAGRRATRAPRSIPRKDRAYQAWTAKEIERLISMHQAGSSRAEIVAALPGRTGVMVTIKASKLLGPAPFRRDRVAVAPKEPPPSSVARLCAQQWSPEEEDILRRMFNAGGNVVEILKALPGRNRRAVYSKAHRMFGPSAFIDVHKALAAGEACPANDALLDRQRAEVGRRNQLGSQVFYWSQPEIDTIVSMFAAGASSVEIAAAFGNRTANGVASKVTRLFGRGPFESPDRKALVDAYNASRAPTPVTTVRIRIPPPPPKPKPAPVTADVETIIRWLRSRDYMVLGAASGGWRVDHHQISTVAELLEFANVRRARMELGPFRISSISDADQNNAKRADAPSPRDSGSPNAQSSTRGLRFTKHRAPFGMRRKA